MDFRFIVILLLKINYHIETHSGIRTLRPASGLQTYPLAIGNGVRFNMVGSQGVEPRCPLGRLIYSQVQSPVLLATHVLHQIFNERYNNETSIQQ